MSDSCRGHQGKASPKGAVVEPELKVSRNFPSERRVGNSLRNFSQGSIGWLNQGVVWDDCGSVHWGRMVEDEAG